MFSLGLVLVELAMTLLGKKDPSSSEYTLNGKSVSAVLKECQTSKDTLSTLSPLFFESFPEFLGFVSDILKSVCISIVSYKTIKALIYSSFLFSLFHLMLPLPISFSSLYVFFPFYSFVYLFFHSTGSFQATRSQHTPSESFHPGSSQASRSTFIISFFFFFCIFFLFFHRQHIQNMHTLRSP